jgi:hypothetical protein
MEDDFFDELEQEQKAGTESRPVEKKNDVDDLEAVAKEQSQENNSSVFDYNDLPDAPTQKYERVELDGETVTIKEAKIEFPDISDEWKKTLKGDGYFKNYIFTLSFDTENKDREFLSGLKGFKEDKKTKDNIDLGNGVFMSRPNLFRTGKNQTAQLFQKYKAFVLKSGVSNEEFEEKYGLKHMMNFLNSNPRAKIETISIEFQGKTTRKNIVKEFV